MLASLHPLKQPEVNGYLEHFAIPSGSTDLWYGRNKKWHHDKRLNVSNLDVIYLSQVFRIPRLFLLGLEPVEIKIVWRFFLNISPPQKLHLWVHMYNERSEILTCRIISVKLCFHLSIVIEGVCRVQWGLWLKAYPDQSLEPILDHSHPVNYCPLISRQIIKKTIFSNCFIFN